MENKCIGIRQFCENINTPVKGSLWRVRASHVLSCHLNEIVYMFCVDSVFMVNIFPVQVLVVGW